MRKVQLFLVAAIMTAAFSITAYAGDFKKNDQGFWYQNDDGTYPTSKLTKVGENWYYFNEAGYAQAGFIELPNGWFELSDQGICRNPIDPTTQEPAGAPYGGWIQYVDWFGSKEDLGAVYHNNFYWIKFYDVTKTDTFNATLQNENQ